MKWYKGGIKHMERLYEYKNKFSKTLFEDFIPFWEKFSPDPIYGGFLCGFDRDGELFFEDKSVWQQGRSLWMFSKLYNEFEKNPKWLEFARSGYDFINKYCFDENGHMYFKVTRDGKPLINRRYYFSEAFAIMGYAEFYIAVKDEEVKQRAVDLFKKMFHYYITPGCFPPKVNPKTRSVRTHSIVMIMLNVCQHMRKIDDSPIYNTIIDACISEITNNFVKEDEKALFETVGAHGERLNSPEGRLINPGHSMETAWFLMEEAAIRKDAELMKKAIQITEWSFDIGWDKEMGGIFYFRDIENKPVLSLEWDMKLLWPHCEALIAFLRSYMFTGQEKYLDYFDRITEYIYAHFPDPGHPEWFGHLHRDGTPISYIKGSDWKGPYHNVRAFMQIIELLKQYIPY